MQMLSLVLLTITCDIIFKERCDQHGTCIRCRDHCRGHSRNISAPVFQDTWFVPQMDPEAAFECRDRVCDPFFVNIVGGIIGIGLDLNWINALVAGFFGAPGVVVLLVIKYLL